MKKMNNYLAKFLVFFGINILVMNYVDAQSNTTPYKPKAYREDYRIDYDACVASGANNQTMKNCMEGKGWRQVDKSRFDSEMQSCRDEQNASGIPPENKAKVYFSCMLSKGWDVQTRSAENIARLVDGLRAECAKDEYREIVAKSPCNTNAISLEQLSDRSKISDNQKQAFLSLSKYQENLYNSMLAAYRNGSLAEKKYAEEFYFKLPAARQAIDLDLYKGKISWGDFNSKRKELATTSNGVFARVNQDVDNYVKGVGPAPVLGVPTSSQADSNGSSLDSSKEKCKELGMKPGTEAYGKCILQLSK